MRPLENRAAIVMQPSRQLAMQPYPQPTGHAAGSTAARPAMHPLGAQPRVGYPGYPPAGTYHPGLSAGGAATSATARSPSGIQTIDLTGSSPVALPSSTLSAHASPAASPSASSPALLPTAVSPLTPTSYSATTIPNSTPSPLHQTSVIAHASLTSAVAHQTASTAPAPSAAAAVAPTSTSPSSTVHRQQPIYSFGSMPTFTSRRHRQIIILIESGFGFGSTTVLAEVIELLKSVHFATHTGSEADFALILFAASADYSDGGTQESPFTPSLIVFTHWIQGITSPKCIRTCHTGDIATPLHLALRKFTRSPPADGLPVERYILLLSNTYPDDWILGTSSSSLSPSTSGVGRSAAIDPLNTAAAMLQCKERNIGLSCWSTREIPHFEQMVRASVIEETPPKISSMVREVSPEGKPLDRTVIFSAVSFPPFWTGQFGWKVDSGTFLCKMAARTANPLSSAFDHTNWSNEITITNASFHQQTLALWADHMKDKQHCYLVPLDKSSQNNYSKLLPTLRTKYPTSHVQFFVTTISASVPSSQTAWLYGFLLPSSQYLEAYLVYGNQIHWPPAQASTSQLVR